MSDKTFLSVFRVWAACAWADGILDPREALSLENLVIRNRGISDLARRTAYSWIESEPQLEELEVKGMSKNARWKIYEAAFALAVIDDQVTEEERSILDRLVEMLELDKEQAKIQEKECIRRLFT